MHERDGFSAKTLGKSLFQFQTDWSGNGPAGQFRQIESALGPSKLINGLMAVANGTLVC